MSDKTVSQIDINAPFEQFSSHYNLPENRQIMFSAPFGSGKTFFLKKFFESIDADVNTFWLNPIKYVVSQNEDIFEYIKFDIANQLLRNDIIYSEIKAKYNDFLFTEMYLYNNPSDIIKLLFSVLESSPNPMSKVVGKAGTSFMSMLESKKAYADSLKENLKLDREYLAEYLMDSINIKGSIYEDDLISRAIRDCIQKIKGEGDKKKENVLIIDDLDRLDPEHIFRILNILSVHQDQDEVDNKFGFDKIIVVCDFENIEKMYHYKYGPEVDFNGYIDKFFSTDVFRFSNYAAIALFCSNDIIVKMNSNLRYVMGQLLVILTERRMITLRNIIKYRINGNLSTQVIIEDKITFKSNLEPNLYYDHNKSVERNYDTNTFYINSEDLDFFLFLKIMTLIFGDYKRFKAKIKELSDKGSQGSSYVFNGSKVILGLGQINIFTAALNDTPLFVANYLPGNYSRNGRELKVPTIPSTVLWGKRFNMNLGWTSSKPYDGTSSLYSKVNDIDNFPKISNQDGSEIRQGVEDISLEEVSGNILKNLETLEKKGIAQRLGFVL